MNILMLVHIAAGLATLPAGAIALSASKGGRFHRLAGTTFLVTMLVLGATATPLAWLKDEPDSGIGGIFACYFVLTAWIAARRRDGTTSRFEIIACAVALGSATVILLGALVADATTPAGRGPLFALAAICVLAGFADLRAILSGSLTRAQRLTRHLWRMCFAFFIATGSFFMGQQDILPASLRGSPLILLLAFAPLAIMLFWLVRMRLPTNRSAAAEGRAPVRAHQIPAT